MKLTRYQNQINSPSARRYQSPDFGFSRFEDLFDRIFGTPLRNDAIGDVFEDENHFYVRHELPGVPKEAIAVSIENGQLRIEVKAADETKASVSERHFESALTLPEGIDAERVSASAENGILTVTLPKTDARRSRAVEVN